MQRRVVRGWGTLQLARHNGVCITVPAQIALYLRRDYCGSRLVSFLMTRHCQVLRQILSYVRIMDSLLLLFFGRAEWDPDLAV
jgi:hypothetical protein